VEHQPTGFHDDEADLVLGEHGAEIIGCGAGGPEFGLLRAGIEETAHRIELSKAAVK
jgi:hypothetical protein